MQWLSSLGPVGEVLRVIILIVEVLLVFNLMILVHEWGHFLAARWRGLKVEAFYIWFGKPLWKKTINGVEYGLGSIPAGGFVKLPQMAPMDAIEGGSNSTEPLPPITPLDKAIVAFAGPLFSFGLAVLFACLVAFFGKPESEQVRTTTIGHVDKGSRAEKAGLKPGDVIKSIDGHPIKRFEGAVDSVRWAMISGEGENLIFKVERPGTPEVMEIAVPAKNEKKEEQRAWWQTALHWVFKRPALRDIGIEGRQTPLVGPIQKNSPADDAGLKTDDLILSVNGMELLSPEAFNEYLMEKKPKEVALVIRRYVKNSQEFTDLKLNLVPRVPDVLPDQEPEHTDFNRPMIGIGFNFKGHQRLTYPSVGTQVSDASRSMYNMITKLIAAKSDISPALMSGPVGIGRVYYNILQDPSAFQLVLWFSVVLNINLAIMNMMPFPVLDGGHITLAAMEAIRRRSVHSRFLEKLQFVCALSLFGFIIFVTLKDFGDMFGGDKKKLVLPGWKSKEERAQAAPSAATPPAPAPLPGNAAPASAAPAPAPAPAAAIPGSGS